MKNVFSILRFLVVFCILSFAALHAGAYSLRQYSSRNGLSNSAILSICQDNQGFMWFGSCDGLNMFDGLNIRIYKPTSGANSLAGNLIENIVEAEEGILWVQTNYGLSRFDTRDNSIRSFKDFNRKSHFALTQTKDVFIINEDECVSYYDRHDGVLRKIPVPGLKYQNILDVLIDSVNRLWIFTRGKNAYVFSILTTNEGFELKSLDIPEHDEELLYCFHEGDMAYFIDKSHGLYEYDLLSRKKYYIYDLHHEITENGDISSLVKHHDDYYIGFKTSGLLRLMATPEQKTSFRIVDINIKSGIFCIVKDKHQDVLWVGTDGQGVYMYFIDAFSIKSTLLNNLPYPVNNPVRGLFIDKKRTLWIGTKGDGILKISNFDAADGNYGKHNTEHLVSGNSLLNDNSVYTFARSRKNILWIGSEGGLNYYSYKENKIKKIHFPDNIGPVRYIHSICEFNDTTLWIATVGEGIIKATLGGKPDEPVLEEAKRITMRDGGPETNSFFTIYQENDSILWFGNRGYGAYRMNAHTGTTEIYLFDEEGNNQTLNDIFSIIRSNDGYWFGTSYGLAHLNGDKKEVFNETNGFPNNTIHGILDDRHDNLWLSTNRGLVKFNIGQQTFQSYSQPNELEVIEYSDGAFFKDEITGTLFFGGINGFISIRENDYIEQEYTPAIQFNSLTIFGKDYNIHDFMAEGVQNDILQLDYSQNFFSISFTAIDYIHGNNYTYLYKLDELSDNWIENGNLNVATFTNISPGKYTLSVKYRNNITGKESITNTLSIRILPPWYKTRLAYLVYMLLVLMMVYAAVKLSMKWYRMKKSSMIEKLNQQQKEEVYESKLRFFTNITHELCTPLTLIYGPCMRIISYPKADDYITKYVQLIQHNAEKLNGLIQELIEFRRLETGNKSLDIKEIPVSEFTETIARSFTELAESKGINYRLNIEPDIMWHTDAGCLNKITTNLLSNAFKYADEQGEVLVNMYVENCQLYLLVSNTGKGIKKEDIPLIFDRYKILDSFEKRTGSNLSQRNGLGLAICDSMVKLLQGQINVSSELNGMTVFTVILPLPEITSGASESVIIEEPLQPALNNPAIMPESVSLSGHDKSKRTLMIIDDDSSMLWFVAEIFTGKYNVIPVKEAEKVPEMLRINRPDLIISDIMMPGIDGISLAKTIKNDKLLKHIPLVMLSAKNDVEAQVEGMDSGAEVYITKPFNVEYLQKVVDNLLRRNEDLKEYFSSAYSSVEINDGRILHKEEKEFFDKMLRTIEENLVKPDLNVEMLSSLLGISTRQLYRKLKNVTDKTPNDIIREYRLTTVGKLLVSSNLSVDEIMYKAGFANRGNFFKVFAQRYGMTPKKYREMRKEEIEENNPAKS